MKILNLDQKNYNMGLFSWITMDTRRSICCSGSGFQPFTVYMHDDRGNVWKEKNYKGNGIFGGKDYYLLFAEMNGINGGTEAERRRKAISVCHNGCQSKIVFPILQENPKISTDFLQPNLRCQAQGYFYCPEEDDCDKYCMRCPRFLTPV